MRPSKATRGALTILMMKNMKLKRRGRDGLEVKEWKFGRELEVVCSNGCHLNYELRTRRWLKGGLLVQGWGSAPLLSPVAGARLGKKHVKFRPI